MRVRISDEALTLRVVVVEVASGRGLQVSSALKQAGKEAAGKLKDRKLTDAVVTALRRKVTPEAHNEVEGLAMRAGSIPSGSWNVNL
jgi:hypothetical protein